MCNYHIIKSSCYYFNVQLESDVLILIFRPDVNIDHTHNLITKLEFVGLVLLNDDFT